MGKNSERYRIWAFTLCVTSILLFGTVVLWVRGSETQPLVLQNQSGFAQNVPTLAPPKPTLADEVLSFHTWNRLSAIRVKDGDTVAADIELGRGVVWRNRDIRLSGLDTWESGRYRRTIEITDEELRLGRKAAEALATLLLGPETRYVCLGPGETGDYGREEGPVYCIRENGEIVDVAKYMLERGYDRNRESDGSPRE